ncbi:MAG: type II toxin-antitoxin system Phd/YefM family antitoxin [Deltaproteobacteria bacterium]|nr:MAG: type II toxin-antitoxin system Phd/YefM family antitoxin [Deltaproteobacteria bacterium]
MEFVNVRDLRINTSQVWEKLEHEKELIITSNGKPLALMSEITGSNLEAILAAVRRTRGEWAIRKLRQASEKNKTVSLSEDEIQDEIKKVRRGKNK